MPSALWRVLKGAAAAPPATGCHHGRLDLQEAALVEERADAVEHLAAALEGRACLLVGDQVQVTLPVARLHVH